MTGAVRPSKQSLQQWADAVNDPSYAFDRVLPYYQKSVHFTPADSAARFPNATVKYEASAFSPAGGPLQVTYPNYAAPFSTWMKRGLQDVGMAEATDFNSGSLMGAQYVSFTIEPSTQTRSSSESSFLARKPPTLTVLSSTRAKRILFDDKNRAVGVRVVGALGLAFDITAAKEVIVSAGAFQSPQLLMVSGIGPPSTLQQHGIAVRSGLAGVGQNLWDHVMFPLTYRVTVPTFGAAIKSPAQLLAIGLQYLTSRSGPLTSPFIDVLGWEKIPSKYRQAFAAQTSRELSSFSDDWPEVEV
ncbi:hypothetical protein CDD83_310 [Cordyceps sp. RAO-2017]|nr:hypothetical protein CDD83_310 [Cordyceps sp. RAO-2017]